MADLRLVLHGIDDALHRLKRLGEGAARFATAKADVHNRQPYFFGIETGRDRSGRLRRRAGGAFMVKQAKEEAKPFIRKELAGAIPEGAAAVDAAMQRGAEKIIALAEPRTPKRSGNLREGYYVQGKR